MDKAKRFSKKSRETEETQIVVSVDIDGSGNYKIDTGNGMFDHLLAQISRHGLIDLDISAKGDTHVGWHHLVEDTAIVCGKALKEAVGDGVAINRVGNTYMPLDEALVLTVVDYSGRGYSVIDAPLTESDLGGLPSDLIRHFMESFSREGGFNLHVKVLSGKNNHHIAEATFKSLARSLKQALEIDTRRGGKIASTKGTISK